MACDFVNSEFPDCGGLTSCWREECIANEKAALALVKRVGDDMDGNGNNVTAASKDGC